MTAATTKYLSAGQAARRLGVSHESIRRYVMRGLLPAVDTPLGRLFDPADIEQIRVDRAQFDRTHEAAREIAYCRGCGAAIAWRDKSDAPYQPMVDEDDHGAVPVARIVRHSYEPDGRLIIKCEACGKRARLSPQTTPRAERHTETPTLKS